MTGYTKLKQLLLRKKIWTLKQLCGKYDIKHWQHEIHLGIKRSHQFVFSPHHENGDVGEEGCSDDQQHHRPGKPEAQVPKVKPAQSRADLGTRVKTERLFNDWNTNKGDICKQKIYYMANTLWAVLTLMSEGCRPGTTVPHVWDQLRIFAPCLCLPCF